MSAPEVLGGGPLGKVRSGDIVRVDAVAGTLDALVGADADGLPRAIEARPADCRRRRARLGRRSSSAACAQRAERRGRRRHPGSDRALNPHEPRESPTTPSIWPATAPSFLSSSSTAYRGRGAASALVAGGVPGAGGDAAHAGGPGLHQAMIAGCRAIVGAGHGALDRRRAGGQGRRLPVRGQPRLHPEIGRACLDIGLPLLPGVSTASGS